MKTQQYPQEGIHSHLRVRAMIKSLLAQRSYTSTTWIHIYDFIAETPHKTVQDECGVFLLIFSYSTHQLSWTKPGLKESIRTHTEFCITLVYIHNLTYSTAIFESTNWAAVSHERNFSLNV